MSINHNTWGPGGEPKQNLVPRSGSRAAVGRADDVEHTYIIRMYAPHADTIGEIRE